MKIYVLKDNDKDEIIAINKFKDDKNALLHFEDCCSMIFKKNLTEYNESGFKPKLPDISLYSTGIDTNDFKLKGLLSITETRDFATFIEKIDCSEN